MASQSEPNTPAKEATGHALNWNWLSARIEPGANLMLSDWLDDQLSELEAAFSDFTTEKSISRSLHRSDENQSRR